MLIAVVSWPSTVLNWLVLFVGMLLIVLVLIQRGKGGGLAGAFGGAGGSSAFGSRAGDLFTRITLILAGIWILLIMGHIWAVQIDKTTESPASVLQTPQ